MTSKLRVKENLYIHYNVITLMIGWSILLKITLIYLFLHFINNNEKQLFL